MPGIVLSSTARGVLTVLYPSELMESLFPGKLYSKAKNHAPLIDSGMRLTLEGTVFGDFFIAKNAGYADETQGFLPRSRSLCRLAFRRVLYAWGKAGGMFLALVTGSREYTEERLAALFTAAGLAHVLALSGMHLSIFTGFSSKIGRRVSKHTETILSFVMVCAFVWFAGFTPSLRRAFLCFLLNFCAKLAGKKAPSTVLSVAFVLHVCAAPAEATSVSFMLSYLGLAGILYAAKVIEMLLSRVPAQWLAKQAATSAGAFIATSPVTVRVFGFLTPISIVSSICVSPLVTVFILSGIVCFVLTLVFPPLTFALGTVMNALYAVILVPVTLFSHVPQVTIPVP
jgi:competence protein ComEC